MAMRRRDFVRRLPVVTTGLAIGLASVPLTACAGAPYLVPRVRPGGLVVPASALAASDFAFVQAPGMERPVFLHRDGLGELIAVLASCTHQGCQPEPVGERLVCPCHGSEFSFTGALLEGPADRPLELLEVSEVDGEIVVWTSRDRR
jgi:nitrite reductase/ring-hydroxylating ferredoxin subunit